MKGVCNVTKMATLC